MTTLPDLEQVRTSSKFTGSKAVARKLRNEWGNVVTKKNWLRQCPSLHSFPSYLKCLWWLDPNEIDPWYMTLLLEPLVCRDIRILEELWPYQISRYLECKLNRNTRVYFSNGQKVDKTYVLLTSFPGSLTFSHIMNKVTLSWPFYNSNWVVN